MAPLQLRRLFLHHLSPQMLPHRLLSPQPAFCSRFAPAHLVNFLSKHFSSESETASASATNPKNTLDDADQELAQSLSRELLASSDADPLPVSQRLHLNFSHIRPTPSLVLSTLNLSPEAGRTVLGFNQWLTQNANFSHSDETLSFFTDYFGRRKDFKATHDFLVENKEVLGPKTLESCIDRLVRAGRPTQVLGFFERMERDYGFKRDKDSLRVIVEKLCENGYASYAEKLVKNTANEIFPDDKICDLLIKGWCVDGKLEEAKRLAGEMYRGGFELGTMAFNAILDCVCKLCRKKDAFRLDSEAEKVLVDMDYYGVPRDVETFNVMITNLCKIRRTEDAMKLFNRMGEWGCHPNETTYLVLIKSLYQAARVGEGDEMIDRMKSAGYVIDKKAYYAFLKILFGIERVEHAMTVFAKMKKDGCKPGIKTYDLLMGKWCAHNRVDKANVLFKEALKNGLPVTPKEYRVEPRFLKKPKPVKKEKKRETLPEKMARKRRRLKQIRLSFVKKPRRTMMR
ncbi:pentatricopeptide repeat-containing protein PNM1, mitochondrial-like [Mangifera indica]|uniref:pentatricopeptide repeat-containing protein PNM1, mitochondrial-like n=1 Tax=Mangifera indica TaxID=29780 RepID=UPI001CFA0428|nr:pentatricopeptide repeat-containing protein PNM1, mitochondrial-like [Mangifera indica]